MRQMNMAAEAKRDGASDYRKRALFISWEYPGVSSTRGVALTHRIGQLVDGFAAAGWHVDAVHKRQRADDHPPGVPFIEPGYDGLVVRYPIEGPGVEPTGHASGAFGAVARVAGSYWHGALHGDRSGRWARAAWDFLRSATGFERPDLVVAFHTPRGPLHAANLVHRHWSVPWIADLQDPALEGVGPHLRGVIGNWLRRTLASATHVVQVSPEWAQQDAALLGRPVEALRHAIPAEVPLVSPRSKVDGVFRLIFAGTVNPSTQDVGPLLTALHEIDANLQASGAAGLELLVAGTEHAFNDFRQRLPTNARPSLLRWLGWLQPTQLGYELVAADCLVVIPWQRGDRQHVPSKLYQYLAYGRPVILAGPDSGGISALLREWGHPDVTSATVGAIRRAVENVMKGSYAGTLHLSQCVRRPLFVPDLVARYLSWATATINAKPDGAAARVPRESPHMVTNA